MKIFSKFQDYYDSALGSFVESEVIINRKRTEVKVPYKDMPDLGEFDGSWDIKKTGKFGTSYSTIPISMVGFCGKWYFFIHEPPTCGTERNYFVYKDFESIKSNNCRHCLFGWKNEHDFKDPNNDPFWTGLFEKYGPVLYVEEYRPMPQYVPKDFKNKNMNVVVWPELKQLKFQAVKDPYTALWELEHWFDSHARPDEAIVPVGDDITRLQAYGFDKKTSFRKPKEKK